jgi:hypothetical protein
MKGKTKQYLEISSNMNSDEIKGLEGKVFHYAAQ